MKSLDFAEPRPLTGSSGRYRPGSSIAVKRNFPFLMRIFLLPTIATTFLWLTSANDITPFQWLAAFLLLCFVWGGYCKWLKQKQSSIPLFSMIAFMYWLYYGFPLFWGDRAAVASWVAGELISQDAITGAMLMVLLGLVSLWLGIRCGVGRRWSPKRIPDIPHNPSRWNYLRFVMIFSGVISFFEIPNDLFGDGTAQVLFIFQAIIPMIPFAILFRHYLRGEANSFDKILLLSFIVLRIVLGMSSIWLGALVYVMITCAAIYIVEKRKIPSLAVVLLIVYVLFFQVGKSSVRQKYWYNQEEGSKVERIAYWMGASLDKWEGAINDPSGEMLRDMFYQSLSRVALLTQTANVLEMTPAIVPYQYGRLYSYTVIGLIPRFVWPDKPSANEANQFYQVAYGITAEEDLAQGSFSVGFLTESYISFGWPGVIGVMFLIGIFLDFFQKTFLAESSGLLLRGVGVVLLPYFLSIEVQLSVYLGGVVQRILLIMLLFLPIIRFRKIQHQPVQLLKTS